MEVKNFVMMTVTLIIGVILVAGVLTPIIADSIGSDNGGSGIEFTNEGNYHYTMAKAGTSADLYVTLDDGVYYLYDTDPEQNPEAQRWESSFMNALCKDGYIRCAKVSSQLAFIYMTSNNAIPCEPHIHFDGTTATLTAFDTSTVTISDVYVYESKDGDYVLNILNSVYSDYESYQPYVGNMTFATLIMGIEDHAMMCGKGTVSDMSADGFYATNDTVWTTPVSFTLSEDKLASISFMVGGENKTCDVMYSQDNFGDWVSYLIVPVSGSESGGGTGVSGTLATLLTVIPILVMAGLVIMTVTYFRRA